MKKLNRSVFLIGIVFFHSLQISASRDLGDLARGAMAAISNTYAQTIIAGAVSAAVLGGPEYRAKIAKDIETFVFSQHTPQTFPHQTGDELSLVGQNAELAYEIKTILDKKLNENAPCNTVFMCYGDPGTGKTTTAESIATYLKKSDQFDKLYTIRQEELTKWAKEMFPHEEIGKTDLLYRFAEYINANTPEGKRSVFHIEEYGADLLEMDASDGKRSEKETSLNALKGFAGVVKGDGGKKPAYDKLVIMLSSNVTHNQKINSAIADRITPVPFYKPTEEERVNFFKNCSVNIEQNGQFHGSSQVDNKIFSIDPSTYVASYIPFIGKSIYNNAQQEQRNMHQKNNFLVTDAMITKEEEKHRAKLAKMQEKAQIYKNGITWTTWLDSNFNKQTYYQREQDKRNAQAQEIKIKELQARGFATPTVLAKLDDMTMNDAQFLAEKTNPIIKEKSSKENIVREETSKRYIDDKILQGQAQAQELSFIVDLQDHLKKSKGASVTSRNNPKLWEKMNLHMKYCAETLSTDTDKDTIKKLAQDATKTNTQYFVNPGNRTYTCAINNSHEQSAPITFGDITKAHLAAAAYGDDFKNYETKDAAALTIGKAFKSLTQENKDTFLQNLKKAKTEKLALKNEAVHPLKAASTTSQNACSEHTNVTIPKHTKKKYRGTPPAKKSAVYLNRNEGFQDKLKQQLRK